MSLAGLIRYALSDSFEITEPCRTFFDMDRQCAKGCDMLRSAGHILGSSGPKRNAATDQPQIGFDAVMARLLILWMRALDSCPLCNRHAIAR